MFNVGMPGTHLRLDAIELVSEQEILCRGGPSYAAGPVENSQVHL